MDKKPEEMLKQTASNPSIIPYISVGSAVLAVLSLLLARSLRPIDDLGQPSFTRFGISLLILIFITAPALLTAIVSTIVGLIAYMRGKQ